MKHTRKISCSDKGLAVCLRPILKPLNLFKFLHLFVKSFFHKLYQIVKTKYNCDIFQKKSGANILRTTAGLGMNENIRLPSDMMNANGPQCGECLSCKTDRCNLCSICVHPEKRYACWRTLCTRKPYDDNKSRHLTNWIRTVKKQYRKEMEEQYKRKKQFLELEDELKKAQEFIKVKNKKICRILRKYLRGGSNCQSPIFKGSTISKKGYKGTRYNYRSYSTFAPGHDRVMYLKNLLILHSFLGREKGEREEKKPGRNFSPQNYQKTRNKILHRSTQTGKEQQEAGKQKAKQVNLPWETYHCLGEKIITLLGKCKRKLNSFSQEGITIQKYINHGISSYNVTHINMYSRPLCFTDYAYDPYPFKTSCKIKIKFKIFMGYSKFFLFQKSRYRIDRYCYNNQDDRRSKCVTRKTYLRTGHRNCKPSSSQSNIPDNPEVGLTDKNQEKHLFREKTFFAKKLKNKMISKGNNANITKQGENRKGIFLSKTNLIRGRQNPGITHAQACPRITNFLLNKCLYLGTRVMERTGEMILAGLKIRGVIAMFMEYLKQLHPSNRTLEAWKVAKSNLENLAITSREVTTVINHTYYILGEDNYAQKCQELFLATAEMPTDEIDSLIIQHMEENTPNLRVRTKGELKHIPEQRFDRYLNEPGASTDTKNRRLSYEPGEWDTRETRPINLNQSSNRSSGTQGNAYSNYRAEGRKEDSSRTVDEIKAINSISKFLSTKNIDEIRYNNPPTVIMRDHILNYPGEITLIPSQWWHKNNGTRLDISTVNLHYGCSSYYWKDILVTPYNPVALIGETLMCNLRPFYFLCLLWAVAKANHTYREQLRKMLGIKEARDTIKEIMKSNKHWMVKNWHHRNMENALEIYLNKDGNADIKEKFLYIEPQVTPKLHQSRKPTFVDGTIQQDKKDILEGFTHLDIYIGAERIHTYDRKEMLALGSEYKEKIIRTWIRTIDRKLDLKDGKKHKERSRSKDRRGFRERRSSTNSRGERRSHRSEGKSGSGDRSRHESGYHSRSRDRKDSKGSSRSKSEGTGRRSDKDLEKEKEITETRSKDESRNGQNSYKIPRIRLSEQEEVDTERKRKPGKRRKENTQMDKKKDVVEIDLTTELIEEAKQLNQENMKLETEIKKNIDELRKDLKLDFAEADSTSESEDGKYSEGEIENIPSGQIEIAENCFETTDPEKNLTEMHTPESIETVKTDKKNEESKPVEKLVFPNEKEMEEESASELMKKLAVLQAQLMEKLEKESREDRKRKRGNTHKNKKPKLDEDKGVKEVYSSSDDEDPEPKPIQGKRKKSPPQTKKQKSISPKKLEKEQCKSPPGEKSKGKQLPTADDKTKSSTHDNPEQNTEVESEETEEDNTEDNIDLVNKNPGVKTPQRYRSKNDCTTCKGCNRNRCNICCNCRIAGRKKRCPRQICLRGKSKLGRFIIRHEWKGSVQKQRRLDRQKRWGKEGPIDIQKGEHTDDSFEDMENSSSEDDEIREYKGKHLLFSTKENRRQVQSKNLNHNHNENISEPVMTESIEITFTESEANNNFTDNKIKHIFFTGNNTDSPMETQDWILRIPSPLSRQVTFFFTQYNNKKYLDDEQANLMETIGSGKGIKLYTAICEKLRNTLKKRDKRGGYTIKNPGKKLIRALIETITKASQVNPTKQGVKGNMDRIPLSPLQTNESNNPNIIGGRSEAGPLGTRKQFR